jgi:hypothetical protein
MASVLSSLSLVAGLLVVGPVVLLAQRELSSGPLTVGPVADAPFSAVATTIVRRSLQNGTRIDRTATARSGFAADDSCTSRSSMSAGSRESSDCCSSRG